MRNKIEFFKNELEKKVNQNRFIHSLEVADFAKKLALRFGANSEKAEIAGILHDYCKDWDSYKLADFIKKSKDLPSDLLEYSEELWHGPVASIVIQDELNISDEEIINSIRYHTTGRENMSVLEKIICLSDYIEPNRQFEGVNRIRILAEKDLDKAMLATYDGAIRFLLKKKSKIYYLTIEARNYLVDDIAKKQKEED